MGFGDGRRCNGNPETGCPGGRRGFGRGRGMGGDGDMVRGRMLAQGDLRLIALALIEEQPRHGYDIIKVLEEKTAGLYAPSPGVVYPTLTYLEDVGYLTSQQEGTKKLYLVTAEGSAHLAENRAIADAVLDRLAAFGDRAMAMRQRDGDPTERRDETRDDIPQLVRAALLNLHAVAAKRLKDNPDLEAELVAILARAAGDLRKA